MNHDRILEGIFGDERGKTADEDGCVVGIRACQLFAVGTDERRKDCADLGLVLPTFLAFTRSRRHP